MNSKPSFNSSHTVHLSKTTMSHTVTETNPTKINDHNKTRSVIHHRLHQSRQTKPSSIEHSPAILTIEHQTHDPPTSHNTPRIHRACANYLYNVNKSSVVDYTSAHSHPTQLLKAPSTQYTATQEHTAHTCLLYTSPSPRD